MKKRKKEIGAKIAEELQMPITAICNTFTVEFAGQNNVTVDGCKGVLDYSDSVVTLNLGDTVISFTGINLQIATYLDGQALITGEIIGMEFAS